MFIKLGQVRAGSVILVRGSFGMDPAVRATVNNVEEDIKNGRPGIDYTTANGNEHWAYLDQISKVITY
jgi:hypothetical protein